MPAERGQRRWRFMIPAWLVPAGVAVAVFAAWQHVSLLMATGLLVAAVGGVRFEAVADHG